MAYFQAKVKFDLNVTSESNLEDDTVTVARNIKDVIEASDSADAVTKLTAKYDKSNISNLVIDDVEPTVGLGI
jgi:hypothetical protein